MDKTILVVLTIAAAALLHTAAADHSTVHVVGNQLGWTVPPGGAATYAAWAATQIFELGDILVFNFTTGDSDVARVSKEAFLTCNSTNPITLNTTGPANFTLDALGDYYFISTFQNHCALGQRLAIYVIYAPAPAPFPYIYPPPRAPVTWVVGDNFGWFVPPGGALFYATWAFGKDFRVGDTLVFNFVNGSSDVATVTKDAFFNCTNTTISVYSTSPANITLTTPGDHYYTSTYPRQCIFGQQLAIYVYGSASNEPSPSPSSRSSGAPTTSAYGPSSGISKAPARVSGLTGLAITILSIAIALFH
ncbi:Phytocyanin domain [Dillenia turbinata]|uniref:Phytocyanin domain n=1 Tax=Dillenia turbinata TaxID=194707 RepID=A0AAN8ZLB2_9MAGN